MTGEGSFTPISQWLDTEGNPFDRWFSDQIREITGVDVRELGDELPEQLGDWRP